MVFAIVFRIFSAVMIGIKFNMCLNKKAAELVRRNCLDLK